MKILYVYNKNPGVYQNYLLDLLALAKQKIGVKPLFYKPSPSSSYSTWIYGLKNRLHRLCYKLKLTKSNSLDLKRMQEFDIVHLQHSFLWKKLLPLTELIKKPKIVITLRGGDTYLKPWSYITLAQFYEHSEGTIDAFVVMSKDQKKYLIHWGVPESKIHVIPISFGSTSLAKPKYPNQNVLKLVSAFRMTWEKNITGHLLFAKRIKDKGINFTYDIYGGGRDIDQLYFLVDKFDLKDVITIKGEVENSQLKTILPSYDMFIQLSITESLGMSVIEAQSEGLPSVISDSGGLVEAVMKNKTAIVSHFTEIDDLTQSCVNLWQDKELYYSYSKRAIEYVNSNFTTDIELRRLEKLYASL